MSAITKNHFNAILVATIVITVGLIALALTVPPQGVPARPGEISNSQYIDIAKDLKERCPKLKPYVGKLYRSGNMITLSEYKQFKKRCDKYEIKI